MGSSSLLRLFSKRPSSSSSSSSDTSPPPMMDPHPDPFRPVLNSWYGTNGAYTSAHGYPKSRPPSYMLDGHGVYDPRRPPPPIPAPVYPARSSRSDSAPLRAPRSRDDSPSTTRLEYSSSSSAKRRSASPPRNPASVYNRTVNPKNLVDPRLNKNLARKSSAHQLHCHGQMMTPYSMPLNITRSVHPKARVVQVQVQVQAEKETSKTQQHNKENVKTPSPVTAKTRSSISTADSPRRGRGGGPENRIKNERPIDRRVAPWIDDQSQITSSTTHDNSPISRVGGGDGDFGVTHHHHRHILGDATNTMSSPNANASSRHPPQINIHIRSPTVAASDDSGIVIYDNYTNTNNLPTQRDRLYSAVSCSSHASSSTAYIEDHPDYKSLKSQSSKKWHAEKTHKRQRGGSQRDESKPHGMAESDAALRRRENVDTTISPPLESPETDTAYPDTPPGHNEQITTRLESPPRHGSSKSKSSSSDISGSKASYPPVIPFISHPPSPPHPYDPHPHELPHELQLQHQLQLQLQHTYNMLPIAPESTYPGQVPHGHPPAAAFIPFPQPAYPMPDIQPAVYTIPQQQPHYGVAGSELSRSSHQHLPTSQYDKNDHRHYWPGHHGSGQ